jgi:hypothetical protein
MNPPLTELVLVFPRPRGRFATVVSALGPLWSGELPQMHDVDAFYDAVHDTVLIALRYEQRELDRDVIAKIEDVVHDAGIDLIEPAHLTESERRILLRVATCEHRVEGQPAIAIALWTLSRQMGGEETWSATGIEMPPDIRARDLLSDPPVPPPGRARRASAASAPRPAGSLPMPPTDLGRGSQRQPMLREAEPLPPPPAPPPTPTMRGEEPLPSRTMTGFKRGKRVTADRVKPPPTTNRTTRSFDEVIPKARPDDTIDDVSANPAVRSTRTTTADRVAPHSLHAEIDVRYLRSGRWAPARLRALSLKGAYLITGAFPRVGDLVHIALGLGDLGALVRGAVFHVTTAADIASTGTSGFAVRFQLDDAARAQLSTLLQRARAMGVTITPPPARGSVRLPVVWPVKIGTTRGAIRGDALDVSKGGMFVHPTLPLEVEQPVSFSSVLDDGGVPVAGRALVVRHVSESDAARRGLRSGFGLSILEMGEVDLGRWTSFLNRVQRRSEKRILLGATPARLAELTAMLTSAGYAVMGGTDPGTLVQLSDAETLPPDVAVIDSTLLEGSEPSHWLETLFSARKVPCVTLRGDARRARTIVDRLLAV